MSLHYIEFVSVQRHLLQVEAADETEAKEAMRSVVKTGHCHGMAIYDADNPVLLHEPYGSDDFTPLEEGEGPFWFQGSPFGDDPEWLSRVAGELAALYVERKHEQKDPT